MKIVLSIFLVLLLFTYCNNSLNAQQIKEDFKGRIAWSADGLISTFMEKTDHQNMEPRNDLKYADTNWVLANPGISYIMYSYDCGWGVGLKHMIDGVYKLVWMDTATGHTVTQYNIAVVL